MAGKEEDFNFTKPSGILVDYERIIQPYENSQLATRLKPKIKMPGEKIYSLGVVLKLNSSVLKKLNNLPKGDQRVKYLHSEEFVVGITSVVFLNYDKYRKVCDIIGANENNLNLVLDLALSSLPNNVTLWIGVLIENENFEVMVNTCIKNGFSMPFISNFSPLGYKMNGYGLCMWRKNSIVDIDATNEVKYVMTEFMSDKTKHCNMTARLDRKTLAYFRKLSRMGATWNGDDKITQKEVAGRLVTSDIEKNLTHILKVDESSIVTGEEEGVEISGGIYNFHSHPAEAYENHGVKLGWPSGQDYVGFLGSVITYGTIVHFVVAMEGIYSLALSEYWINHLNEIDASTESFILNNYDLSGRNDRDVNWYLRKVNGILYRGHPLFEIQFKTWSEASTEFDIPYLRSGMNCFSNQCTKNLYDKMYSK